MHLFAGKLSLFALHFVGAGLCSARSSDQIGTSGQIRAPLLQNAPQRLPFQGPIPPVRGKCPEGTKGGGTLSAKQTERSLQICIEKPKPQIQLAVWKGRNEHRGKETSLAAARSVVVVSDAPPAAPSFPSCRKRRGRKGALGYGLVHSASEFRRAPMFQSGVPLDTHLTGILVRAA